MDIKIEGKKSFNFKKLLILLLIFVVFGSAARSLWRIGQAEFSVDRESLVIGEVRRGDFVVTIRGSGVLVPERIRWLSAAADARVEKLVHKAGDHVKTGDVIVELSNPQLVQQLAEEEWELAAQTEEVKASRAAQELALLDQKAVVLNAKLDYESSLLRYNAETILVNQATGAISKLTYERTRLETDQFKERWEISQVQLDQMQSNLKVQVNALNARLNKSRKSVERMQEQVDNLLVRATMDSTVLELPLEPGERVSMGANIAKLAQRDSLIAEIQVPEIQIRDVVAGQKVSIDTRNSKIEGSVIRVDPTVVNGNVQVDVAFTDTLPSDARPDLSVDGEIKVTEINDTLFVERPLFAQSRSTSNLYKISADGKLAQRIPVEIGYGSISQIQIDSGLEVGDRIIVSDPSRFESYDLFHVN